MLVIQRTLSKGRWPAFFTGLGAVFSDLTYCMLTGFFLSFMTDFIESNQFMLQIVGGIVLLGFAVYLFRKNPTRALQPSVKVATNYWRDIVTGFILTFSNPLILFFIIGLYARFNFLLPDYEPYHIAVAYATIFVGALLWWYLVTWIVSKLRRRVNVRSLGFINRAIGLILGGMGLYGIYVAVHDKYGYLLAQLL